MTAGHRKAPEWREFERLVARIEADAGPRGMTVTSPDRIRCKTTARLREVDASIRSQTGTVEMLVTIECRRRADIQDVTWIAAAGLRALLAQGMRYLASRHSEVSIT